MSLRTCVSPKGCFVYGIHKPSYMVTNLREHGYIESLGILEDQSLVDNQRNFPKGDVEVFASDWVYEIPNPFPFRGVTYIKQVRADHLAKHPEQISLPQAKKISFTDSIRAHLKVTHADDSKKTTPVFEALPEAVLLALAANSTDPNDLIQIAHLCCDFTPDPETGIPNGMKYQRQASDRIQPVIKNHAVFETLANNPYLPDCYKQVMVLKPGAQGGSEIVGEWNHTGDESHIYEYLRRNSYIAGGITHPTWLMMPSDIRSECSVMKILSVCAIFIINAHSFDWLNNSISGFPKNTKRFQLENWNN